jgi:hypothetical protein
MTWIIVGLLIFAIAPRKGLDPIFPASLYSILGAFAGIMLLLVLYTVCAHLWGASSLAKKKGMTLAEHLKETDAATRN